MIKAVIFDVYGTLLDTRGCSLKIMKSVLKNCNCDLKEKFVYLEWRKDIESMILGMKTEKSFKSERVFFKKALERTLKRLSIKASHHEKMRLYTELCWAHRSIFPDTKKALKELSKKYKIFIASNSDTAPIKKDFERHKLKPPKVITSENLKIYKPHKKFFLNMLKKIPYKKSEIIYVGDSIVSDIGGPQKAGIKTVWINRKNKVRKKNDPKPDFIVKDLKELSKLDLD